MKITNNYANGVTQEITTINDITTEIWYKNGEIHRDDDEPSIITDSGCHKEWYKNGVQHREDGPAVDGPGGKAWYQNGKRHRENGPAIEDIDGNKEYWINGHKISEEKFVLEKELREDLINRENTKNNGSGKI